MNKLGFYCRLYALLFAQYVKTRMQYRFDFYISNLTMIATNLAGMESLWILMHNFPLLAGWKYEQLIFIYSFSLMAQTLLQVCFDHIWQLRYHLNTGTFIKYYFKPINSLFYYLSEMVDLKGIGLFVCGAAAFVWSSVRLGIVWTPMRLLALPVLLAGSSLLIASLQLIAACGCFWVKDSYSILAFINSFRDQSRYPMDIYNTAFKAIFTFILPMGFFAFYPARVFMEDSALGWTAWASPVFGAFFFFIAVRIWEKGTKIWGGTGS